MRFDVFVFGAWPGARGVSHAEFLALVEEEGSGEGGEEEGEEFGGAGVVTRGGGGEAGY